MSFGKALFLMTKQTLTFSAQMAEIKSEEEKYCFENCKRLSYGEALRVEDLAGSNLLQPCAGDARCNQIDKTGV